MEAERKQNPLEGVRHSLLKIGEDHVSPSSIHRKGIDRSADPVGESRL